MATARPIGLALLLVLHFAPAAVAQVPTAPPPHPVLADVLTEYRRLGLPLPPPNAELLRIKWFDGDDRGEYILGFRVPPLTPEGEPTYLIGYGSWYTGKINSVEAHEHETVEPTAAALRQVNKSGTDLLALATQCEARGWHAFAREVYALARENLTDPVIAELRQMSWGLWEGRITRVGTDRAEALRRLRELAAEDEQFRTPENDDLLRDLERTLAPRKSKPGSVEALIDNLTEAAEDPSGWLIGRERHPAFRKLAALGFDAVPALLAHLDDPRFTRALTFGGNIPNVRDYRVRVGHLASWLLDDLSGRNGLGVWRMSGDMPDPEKLARWWAEAQKVGEEKWLLSKALPVPPKTPGEYPVPPNEVIRMAVEAKYPGRLPELYRIILKEQPWVVSKDYASAIRSSTLPQEQKLAALSEGVKHEHLWHRHAAVEALTRLDREAGRQPVLLFLRDYPVGGSDKLFAIPGGDAVVALVELANNQDCWQALSALAKRSTAPQRCVFTRAVGNPFRGGLSDPHRRERVRFLFPFLDDREAEVRNCAVDHLAPIVGFTMRQPIEAHGPLTRFIIRAAVWQIAERELARPKK